MPDTPMTFSYRMPAGFVGDVTRMTPAAIIEPCGADPTAPPTDFAQPVVIDVNSGGARRMTTGDLAAAVYGLTVRGFPGQAPMASGFYGAADFGNTVPWLVAGNPNPAVDVMRQGYMMVKAVGTPKKGATVYIWTAATAAPHVQGGFEAVNPAASGIALPASCTFNGAPDVNGNVEIAFNIGLS